MSTKWRDIRGNILVAAITLGFISGPIPVALAKDGIAIVQLSSAQFVSNCQRMGGTLSQPSAGGLSCKLPSGTVVSCSFNGDGSAFCNWTTRLTPAQSRDLLGTRLDGTTTRPPKETIPGGDTLN